MKVGLRLNDQFVVTKHNISQVISLESEFHISLVNDEYIVIAREGSYLNYQGESTATILELAVNEYHRVQRELSEYLGVEIKDLDSEDSLEEKNDSKSLEATA